MSDILIRSACGGNSTIVLLVGGVKGEASHWAVLRILAANKRWLDGSSPSNKTPSARAVQSVKKPQSLHFIMKKFQVQSLATAAATEKHMFVVSHITNVSLSLPSSVPPTRSPRLSILAAALSAFRQLLSYHLKGTAPAYFFPPRAQGHCG